MWHYFNLETAFERDERRWRANRHWRSVVDGDSPLSVVALDPDVHKAEFDGDECRVDGQWRVAADCSMSYYGARTWAEAKRIGDAVRETEKTMEANDNIEEEQSIGDAYRAMMEVDLQTVDNIPMALAIAYGGRHVFYEDEPVMITGGHLATDWLCARFLEYDENYEGEPGARVYPTVRREGSPCFPNPCWVRLRHIHAMDPERWDNETMQLNMNGLLLDMEKFIHC